jgi:hypothetical protein
MNRQKGLAACVTMKSPHTIGGEDGAGSSMTFWNSFALLQLLPEAGNRHSSFFGD